MAQAPAIVICEDRAADAQHLRQILESRSLHVSAITANGQELLEWCDQHPGARPVILLDIIMPVLDGYAAFWDLKASNYQAKVIFLSVEGSPGVVRTALTSGAADYITKPFQREDVIARVKRAMSAAVAP